MDNDQLVAKWQRSIIELCVGVLGRSLTAQEAGFINGHSGFLALEAIEGHVRSLDGQREALTKYLSSDIGSAEA